MVQFNLCSKSFCQIGVIFNCICLINYGAICILSYNKIGRYEPNRTLGEKSLICAKCFKIVSTLINTGTFSMKTTIFGNQIPKL